MKITTQSTKKREKAFEKIDRSNFIDDGPTRRACFCVLVLVMRIKVFRDTLGLYFSLRKQRLHIICW